MIEFDCVDCRGHVFAISRNTPPVPARCAGCQFIAEFVDPADYATYREVMGIEMPDAGDMRPTENRGDK